MTIGSTPATSCFSGACRGCSMHAVTRVVPRTMPAFLRGPTVGRLNVTVRDIGRGVIDESQFPACACTTEAEMADDQV